MYRPGHGSVSHFNHEIDVASIEMHGLTHVTVQDACGSGYQPQQRRRGSEQGI
jgi:hypothetical protein